MKDKITALLNYWGVKHRIEHGKFVLKGSELRVQLPFINEDMAYLLGFLCGDGCLGKPQPRKCGGARYKIMISFSGSEKENHKPDIFWTFSESSSIIFLEYLTRKHNEGMIGSAWRLTAL